MATSLQAIAIGVITTLPMQVLQFEWSGTGSVGDTLLLEDNQGRIVWQAIANGTQYDFYKNYGNPTGVNGLNLVTIGSGRLTIFYV